LERLEKEEFDVLVVSVCAPAALTVTPAKLSLSMIICLAQVASQIGGGCVGSGVAWEAATRGLKVALVEADDFAAGEGRSACHSGSYMDASLVFI
jgi:hypothetical protein